MSEHDESPVEPTEPEPTEPEPTEPEPTEPEPEPEHVMIEMQVRGGQMHEGLLVTGFWVCSCGVIYRYFGPPLERSSIIRGILDAAFEAHLAEVAPAPEPEPEVPSE